MKVAWVERNTSMAIVESTSDHSRSKIHKRVLKLRLKRRRAL